MWLMNLTGIRGLIDDDDDDDDYDDDDDDDDDDDYVGKHGLAIRVWWNCRFFSLMELF